MEAKRIKKNSKLAKQVITEGHQVGNHSYSHPDFTKISIKEIKKEIQKSEEIFKKYLNIKPKLFRPPAGKLTKEIKQELWKRDYTIVLWSYSIKDWEGPNSKAIAKRVLSQKKDGAIIILHDKYNWNKKALDLIITNLKNKNYKFKTLKPLKDNKALIKEV